MQTATNEELLAMTSALRPIILDKLIPDFDPVKVGWKTGAAPFGRKHRKLEPLMTKAAK